MKNYIETEPQLKAIEVKDKFWSFYQELIRDVVLPYQEQILKDEIPGAEKSGAIRNLRIAAGQEAGEFYGQVFQDSDVSKWLEAVSYVSNMEGTGRLEESARQVIHLMELAQEDDGYLNTYFQLKEPEHKWQNLLECHELYCAGHLIEAAVADYEMSGRSTFLNLAMRLADLIDSRFGPGKVRGIPGHEEIELALLRLWRVTKEQRYFDLAGYFLEERGTDPNYFAQEKSRKAWMDPAERNYTQNHRPIREQDTAEGHAVRAMYLYTAMADLAAWTADEELKAACVRLWKNVTEKRMYITGGVGSGAKGETFTVDYDLPNDRAYAETCAAVGLVFWARKMLGLDLSGKYADVMERALYNGVLGGMGRDGRHFFYVNHLEVVPGISGEVPGYEHVRPVRPKWYACACCPPNIARLLASLGKYAWGESRGCVYSHLYLGGVFHSLQNGISWKTVTDYPWEGRIQYEVCDHEKREKSALAVRIPGWCSSYSLLVNGRECTEEHEVKDGYVSIIREWTKGDTVSLHLCMEVKRIYANLCVREDAGCTALTRGPLVYCLEEADNGKRQNTLLLPAGSEIMERQKSDELLGDYIGLEAAGLRLQGDSEALYSETPPRAGGTMIYAVPYFLWGNRTAGEMRVWIRET